MVDIVGSNGWDDLIIGDSNGLGILRSQSTVYSNEANYYRWIENQRYNSYGLW